MNGCEHDERTATARVMMARPWPGTVGKTRRATHVVPEPVKYPWRVITYCGEVFWSGDLEWLDQFTGMPCTACLGAVPPPALP